MLFCALVRSNLEYHPLIWTNNTAKQIETIEAIQKNFLRFTSISFGFNIYRSAHDSYDSVLKCINLSSLKNRRTWKVSKFLHNFLLGNINFQGIFSLIRLKINSLNTRSSDLFYSILYKTNYIINGLPNILMAAGDSIIFDFVKHFLFYTIFIIYLAYSLYRFM